ncbi:MAG: arginine--tRNA ligase [Rhodospirillales bacterium]
MAWTRPFGRDAIIDILDRFVAEGTLPAGLDFARVNVEPPRDTSHGHVTTNAAMVIAKPAGMNPREIAGALVNALSGDPAIESAEIAGPGFVNLTLADSIWHAELQTILRQGNAYGDSTKGAGEPINVEYVSVNPTGPMHAGHGRGAVFGDALASLLEKAGYAVTREYWINDAGAQIDALARSLHLRYREALGENIGEIPEGLYPGDYLIAPAREIAERDGDKWTTGSDDDWLEDFRVMACESMMALIRDDLHRMGIDHEVFTSERGIVAAGKVEEALSDLDAKGLLYTGVLEPPKGKTPEDWEPRPQTLFRSTDYGDDVDRPIKKSDDSYTYFATDIAYHFDKYRRGYKTMVDVWGADHGGYVKRLQAAVKALTGDEGNLDVKLCRMVNLMDGGQPLKMSKRAGRFVTMRDVMEEVGRDVFRFIMLTRKNDAPLDFDLQKVKEQSKDNPVFYVQYAHARAHSVMRHAAEKWGDDSVAPETLAAVPLDRLSDPAEIGLLRRMAEWPRTVESAAEAHEPHRVAFYLNDLAANFHALWNMGRDNTSLRFITDDDDDLTRARLAMVRGLASVIASGLAVIGVAPVEEMR